jgi:murein DD-endopeptidase MepM/ murein hydrolase activator NlpD
LLGTGRLFIVSAALALASCARSEAPPRRAVVDVRLPVETETVRSTVPRNATLDSLLRANQLQERFVADAVAAAGAIFDPRRLRAGQPYTLVRSLDGLLREFAYEIDTDRVLHIFSGDKGHPGTHAEVIPFDKVTGVVAIDAIIDARQPSLIAAVEAAGENVQLAMDLADIFSGEVDFRTDLQPGDSVRVLFEKSTREGHFANYGSILAASISAAGRRFDGFRWMPPGANKAAYYDENGRSLRRFFLKSPLKFEPRVTSAFSMRRFHPIDHVFKAHLGVDYGAPTGSPVVAVANGIVVSAGFSGGGGNTVHLRHPGSFETYYLHLSSFGPGIRAGARVSQGQLIGRVGMTGSATGPHLDYRIKKGGVFVNPVLVHSRQAPGEPIPAARLGAYQVSRDTLLARLSATLLADPAQQRRDAVAASRSR